MEKWKERIKQLNQAMILEEDHQLYIKESKHADLYRIGCIGFDPPYNSKRFAPENVDKALDLIENLIKAEKFYPVCFNEGNVMGKAFPHEERYSCWLDRYGYVVATLDHKNGEFSGSVPHSGSGVLHCATKEEIKAQNRYIRRQYQ